MCGQLVILANLLMMSASAQTLVSHMWIYMVCGTIMLCNSIISYCLGLICVVGWLVAMQVFNVGVNLCDRLTCGHTPIEESLGSSLWRDFLEEFLRAR